MPHPASVVALPNRRDSRGDVLANWAWQTDSVEAVDDELDVAHSSRKPLLYVIGAGVAVALIVTIVALGFGSSDAKKPAQAAVHETIERTATSGSGNAERAVTGSAGSDVASSAIGSTPSPEIGSGSDQVAAPVAANGSGSSAPEPAQPEPAKTEPAEPAKTEPAKTEPAKTEPAKTEPAKTAKQEPTKTEPVKPPKAEAKTTPKSDKVAKTDRIARVDPKPSKTSKGTLADPFASPKKSDSTKVDVETTYRTGLQQFARGDTRGALASLRTSLASNPNYAPTWRGLGLVFEKLGEKDQARAAYKRYLQLSPGASDTEQIRGRLERLGA
jgi:hypothetical protein